ncbi:MAG: beta/gamma crystallin-related protein [Brevundimonas sp.]
MRITSFAFAAATILAATAQGTPVEARQFNQSLPGGSWVNTCSAPHVIFDRLHATCRDRTGFPRMTEATISSCASREFENVDGRLTCVQRRERPNDDWNGGRRWRSSIRVYEHTNFNGQMLQFGGEVPNLVAHGFNDRLSSFQLRGAWELCEHVDFRGECRIFDADVTTLVPLGWNDRVSSMRPAGRR